MGKVVLKDGRILQLSAEQGEKLGMVILLSTDLNRIVKVGSESFRINDIVTDQEEILRITQTKMFDVPTVPTTKGRKSKDLA